MARPVRIQGIITIILLALLLVMVVGGIAAAVLLIPGPTPQEPPPTEYTPPPKVDGAAPPSAVPAVSDIRIAAPVIYVIDGGSGMRGHIDGAKVVVDRSIRSLAGGAFNVIVAGEGEDKVLLADMTAGGDASADEAMKALKGIFAMGASDVVRAVKAALAKKPKTVVVFTRKPIYDAADLASAAKAQKTVIHAVAIRVQGDDEVIDTLKGLSQPTGGAFRNLR